MRDSRRFARTPDLTAYVPCLNEQDNVGPTLETLAQVVTAHGRLTEVLVYDDGSTDATAKVVQSYKKQLEERHPELRVELIQRAQSQGLGANFFDGAARGQGRYYLLVNGDHSETREALDAILSRLGEADLVVTYFDTGDQRGPLRRGLSRTFTAIVNGLNGHRLRYYNGPTLHLRQDVVDFATGCSGFAYQAELLTRELDAGRSFVEVAMANRDRETGRTKAFRWKNLLSVAQSLWRIGTRRFPSGKDAP